jgi:radical SAM superfamily enzyme YgiQ (UPF0313 family)
MVEIILTTLNAKYAHASFALRYLMANLGDLAPRAELVEFDINQRPTDIVEGILARKPRIVALGVYIWNATPAAEVAAMLKRISPETILIVGGPEVSFEVEEQAICKTADYVITGEADFTFPILCRDLLAGQRPATKVIESPPADVRKLALPYHLYTENDIAHRVIYVEASRGCPFTCEFCLSSLEVPLRRFPLETFLPAMQELLDRGVQHFKFVDRTFNLSIKYSLQLLEFFLQRHRPGLFLHFEMIPDRLPDELKQILTHFPRGSLQFEVGVQTFNLEVAARIKRKQDYEKTAENIEYLLRETGAYIHADLIIGLPGESLESFAAGFDRLVGLGPQEIQVNILKRLRGTPITRHDEEWEMVYSPHPPYEMLRNKLLDFPTLQRLRRFGRYWDLLSNSGNFLETAPLFWANRRSAFASVMKFSDWLYARHGRTHAMGLDFLAEQIFDFLATELGESREVIAPVLLRDYQRGARREIPKFIRPFVDVKVVDKSVAAASIPKRQARRESATA